MSANDPITILIERLRRDHDQASALQIWDLFFNSLTGLARVRLGFLPGRDRDEEDVVLSVLNSVLCRIMEGTADQVTDGSTLQELIWDRFNDRIHKERSRRRRLGNQVQRDSDAAAADRPSIGQRLADEPLLTSEAMVEQQELVEHLTGAAGRKPTAEEIKEIVRFAHSLPDLNELLDALLRQLPKPRLRDVAQLKLAGFSHEEIADQLDVVERTVERDLREIRAFWSQPGEPRDE